MSTPLLVESPLGQPSLRGSMRASPGGFDLTAGGTDIWLEADQGHFAYAPHEGDFDFSARLASFTATHLYAKAGLMARESTAAGSRHVWVLAFKDNAARNNNHGGFEGQFRRETDGPSSAIYPPQPDPVPPRFPVNFPKAWLRLVRRGNDFEMFVGAAADKWQLFGKTTQALPKKILLGFAVTSHDPASLATASFRDLSL